MLYKIQGKAFFFLIDMYSIHIYNQFLSNKWRLILVAGFSTCQRIWRMGSTFTHSSSTNVSRP